MRDATTISIFLCGGLLGACAGTPAPSPADAASAQLAAPGDDRARVVTLGSLGPADANAVESRESSPDRADQEFAGKRLKGWIDEPPDPRVYTDPDAFARASGNAPVVVDFDDVQAGADLGRTSVPGMEFVAGSAPLLVVRADATWMPAGYEDVTDPENYRLPASSGAQILSPGGAELAPGPQPALEDDDIAIVFDEPVAAIGFDLLSPSMDGMSFTDITLLGANDEVIYRGGIGTRRADATGSKFPPPGASFWGFVADDRIIYSLRIDEKDDNARCPDANIGIDSIRIAPAPDWRAGDVNGDGVVDRGDVEAFTAVWREAGSAPSDDAAAAWSPADVNRDHLVDESDLTLIIRLLGAEAPRID